MNTTRKMLRFGSVFTILKNVNDRVLTGSADAKKDPLVQVRLLADVFNLIYLMADHPLYFKRIQFVNISDKTTRSLVQISVFAWLLKRILVLLCYIVDLKNIKTQQQALVRLLRLNTLSDDAKGVCNRKKREASRHKLEAKRRRAQHRPLQRRHPHRAPDPGLRIHPRASRRSARPY